VSTRANALLWYDFLEASRERDSPIHLVLVAGSPALQRPIVSVAEILGHPGRFRDFELRAVVPDVGGALARLLEEPVEARLRAESVVEGVLVTGRVRGTAGLECARCLVPRAEPVSVDVCELFAASGHGEADDAYRLTGTEMDLEPMLRDALALALPLNPLCREECNGLCARCGADLNAGPCGCSEDEPDPRWAGLAVLRERLGG
jgi:uncharacterized protein